MSYIGKQPRKAALTSSDIEDGIITAAKIEDGAVVASEIASNAVTTAKINADAVTAAKIADNAVVTAGINADAVTGAKIADDAINSEHYTDGSIDTAHLADGQVTTAKLATAVFTGATDIGADIADADLFLMDDGAGGTIRKTTAARLKTYAGGAALATSTNNQVATVTGANALTGESNLLFTGNTLTVGASDNGLITATHSLTIEVGGGEKIDFNTTDSSTNRIRIQTGGNVCVGDGTDHGDNTGRLQVTGRASSNIARFRCGSNGEQISFHNTSNTQVGTITLNASATAYNTSSDYRLKENVNYNFDATTRLKQLKPARFNWIADEDNTLIDGFIAHEVSSVVPEAITGNKDAVKEDGTPNYQGIDQSKIVPLLVKTIQELEARITTLENA